MRWAVQDFGGKNRREETGRPRSRWENTEWILKVGGLVCGVDFPSSE
jgi:hypothetical protein